MLTMARRGRFGSFLVYLIGLLVVGGAGVRRRAAVAATRTRSSSHRARRWPRAWRKGPAVQVATITQGPKERLITLLGDTRPYQVGHAVRQGQRLCDDRSRSIAAIR